MEGTDGSFKVEKSGFNFYAARGELRLPWIPRTQVDLQQIQDFAANPVTCASKSPPFSNLSVEVARPSGAWETVLPSGRFGSAWDGFTFQNLSPSFYVSKIGYQTWDIDPQSCDNLYVDGAWNFQWLGDQSTLSVFTQAQHCHADTDTSISNYAISVWVTGPVGINAWPQPEPKPPLLWPTDQCGT